MNIQSESNLAAPEPIGIKGIRSLTRQWSQRAWLSRFVLRAAQNAPAMLAAHFERSAKKVKTRPILICALLINSGCRESTPPVIDEATVAPSVRLDELIEENVWRMRRGQ